ncbi:restriction endonuclease subunit M [Tamlana sedimentorum]|uniref:site-specific DNA-methyltransferase (adenine-specific) n=1 Tax=Neotamlana sedimentorum TaxID=1435349 RepID=A0A0D7WBF7_9FLAO|nr:N-6 DNA methylase [Tamlana sedimentorum]KJD35082.1 restriction endonuclease subunit M [Tamlana sedimentorum]
MSLYQSSVLKHYLKLQDSEAINKAYKKYTKYFLNPTIQDNIRSSKEEEYQGIFLTELFVNILDYTLKPKANFNLVAEYKNQNNARKADGAILDNDIAIGVIELKGTNTKDLESIRKQAFDYKANQKGCVYVITSNFEKLRFYINDATEFEEFNLFELTPERFELLYICLQKDNVLNNTALKIKEQSVVEEEQITKQFYKDYSVFKRELFRDLVKRNASKLKNLRHSQLVSESNQTDEEKTELVKLEKNVKLTLFKKSQKLIDRYLFIFFAEDRGLLPPNSTQQILDKWKADVDFGDDRPLYTLFKQYFKFLDQGRAGTTNRAEIYAYNGGLFKEDKTLDSLDIDSELLYKHTCKLAAYDFESQVDVNILGHIFENSLNEIESVNAEIEGGDFDKQKSKRKKDGVFYTPKYITKYIVENTIGKLCDEKKTELGFKEEEYFKGRKNRNKTTITKLVNILDTYRDWLLQLTICDPACGSGAFLNQALNFLIAEHQYIDELKTKVLGGGLQFPDIENTILENNIYGVDLNEESVEIAKLSLWLRTAQPRRKLNDLSSNIKCGNSLIDSKAVAGDKAFNWQEQFPKVFENGGFDVIIGNPPYVRQELFKEIKPYLKENYKCYNSIADLYTYFIEKGINLMNEYGLFSFILPNKFLKATYGKNIRKVMKEDANLELLFDFDDYPVFADATTYPIIYVLNKKPNYKTKTFLYSEINKRDNTLDPINTLELKKYQVFLDSLKDEMWNFIDLKKSRLLDKIITNSTYLKDLVDNKIFAGIASGKNDVFIVNDLNKFKYDINASDKLKLILGGSEISRYKINPIGNYILFMPWDYDLNSSESIKKYLINNKTELEKRPEVKSGRFNWWCLSRYGSNNSHLLNKPKIIAPFINNKCNFYLDESGEIYLQKNSMFISSGSKSLLAYLNSKVSFFYLSNVCTTLQGGYYDFRRDKIQLLPIPNNLNEKETFFVQKVNANLNYNKDFNLIIKKFEAYLKQHYNLEKLSKKLQNWHELEFGEFIKELNKAIKANNKLRVKDGLEEIPTLTKKDEFEWLDLFEDNKQKAQTLQTQINQTDKEIDQMVYELYNLTDEEIAIVEQS